MIPTTFTFTLRGDITIIRYAATHVVFKNCVRFIKCITKIDGTIIDDAEDLSCQCIIC